MFEILCLHLLILVWTRSFYLTFLINQYILGGIVIWLFWLFINVCKEMVTFAYQKVLEKIWALLTPLWPPHNSNFHFAYEVKLFCFWVFWKILVIAHLEYPKIWKLFICDFFLWPLPDRVERNNDCAHLLHKLLQWNFWAKFTNRNVSDRTFFYQDGKIYMKLAFSSQIE